MTLILHNHFPERAARCRSGFSDSQPWTLISQPLTPPSQSGLAARATKSQRPCLLVAIFVLEARAFDYVRSRNGITRKMENRWQACRQLTCPARR